MFEASIVFFGIAIAIVWIWVKPLVIVYQRRQIQKRPFPPMWSAVLESNIPIYQHLPHFLKKRLQQHINVFLKEKQFIGCGGLLITDEIKITIAGQACLLLLNESETYYSKLTSILVYPTAYLVKATARITNFLIEEKEEVRLGESWLKDRIVLAWDAIEKDISNWQDGHNVVLHEFAHQLDGEDAIMNGVPILASQEDYRNWSEIFQREYNNLKQNIELGRKTAIDEYGAINPAEFFAVVTEFFFEQPRQMQQKHPELYQMLNHYYKVDPLAWR
jgi:Mlc titration factor MtfA (ptsG expression regulator)